MDKLILTSIIEENTSEKDKFWLGDKRCVAALGKSK